MALTRTFRRCATRPVGIHLDQRLDAVESPGSGFAWVHKRAGPLALEVEHMNLPTSGHGQPPDNSRLE